ncbi:unnamed protein product [Adineta ricciae]|uniref:Integrase catalytic domain-containing protein n=2 Tax=Adineta ricciae TaxID=249248 RepID=A0A815X022_ADIRI|nr:unnamed protein product [Adineta ricciae]
MHNLSGLLCLLNSRMLYSVSARRRVQVDPPCEGSLFKIFLSLPAEDQRGRSDNGKEFVAKVIKDLKNTWTDLVIINGRARHPQTLGLVERGNQTLELVLGKWMQCNQSAEWSKCLAPVVYSINTSTACTTRKTPYEVVFGQPPRSDFEMWKKLSEEGVEDEENMPIDIITAFAEVHQSTTDDGLTDLPEDSNRNSDRIETRALRTESSASHSYSIDPEVASAVAILVDKASSRATDEFIGLPESEVASENVSSTTENEIGHLSSAILRDGRHKRIRTEAEIDYLKAIAKRQRIYDNAIKNSQYKVGDLVGLKIDRVNRTNTTPKILPCKVVSISPSSNDTVMYRLCTLKGVLSVSYGLQDLLDLTKCDFADLRAVDLAGLSTLTFIQACKEYISAGGIQFTETCHCNGKCATKACPCVSKGIKCSTKCHPKKKQSCSNVE